MPTVFIFIKLRISFLAYSNEGLIENVNQFRVDLTSQVNKLCIMKKCRDEPIGNLETVKHISEDF